MNRSNLYTYSILSRVWNDLDYDVLKLVKEYLKVHLNRKILNNDYDKFKILAESTRYEDHDHPHMEELLHEERNYLRYGLLKTTTGWHSIIDKEPKFINKYYLLNTNLCLHLDGVMACVWLRNNFVNNHTKNKIATIKNLNDKGRADYIRTLMDVEELFITEESSPQDTLWYYCVDSDEW